MIHLAISIAAFLFLSYVAFVGLALLSAIFESPKKATAAQRCPQPCLKHNSCLPELVAAGGHDPRSCHVCLHGGH